MLESVTMTCGESQNEARPALRPMLTVASVLAVLAVAASLAEGGPTRLCMARSIEQVLLETALAGSHSVSGLPQGRRGAKSHAPDGSDKNESSTSGDATWNPGGHCVTHVCGIGIAPVAMHPDLAIIAHRVAGLSPPRS